MFQTLLVGAAASRLIDDPRIAASRSPAATRRDGVAEAAGRDIKKTVLELGGSDPFIVLADADLAAAAATAAAARFQNAGQSCIAAKRFIVEASVSDEFQERFVGRGRDCASAIPLDRDTDVGPLARDDLRRDAGAAGRGLDRPRRARCSPAARVDRPWLLLPTDVLTDVTPDMPAFVRRDLRSRSPRSSASRDADEAIALANHSPYGLGASSGRRDLDRARRLAACIEAGQVFINGMVASDPRLPFGGVKRAATAASSPPSASASSSTSRPLRSTRPRTSRRRNPWRRGVSEGEEPRSPDDMPVGETPPPSAAGPFGVIDLSQRLSNATSEFEPMPHRHRVLRPRGHDSGR